MPRPCSAPSCTICTRSGTPPAGRFAASATTRPVPMPSMPQPVHRRPRLACQFSTKKAFAQVERAQAAINSIASPALMLSRPKVAILREQGVNSHVEMAWAFTQAGFEAFDVHMTDLQTGRAKLADFAKVWWPAAASAMATRWARALAGRAASRSTRYWPMQFKGFLRPHRHLWPGRVQRLPDVCRAGRHHPRCRTLAALHHQPERALRGAPEPWWKCWIPPACSSQAWPAAACPLPWRTARVLPTSSTGATQHRQGGHGRHALTPTTLAATEGLPAQPQRQPRRADSGDHG
jgi:hypothetical protein